MQYVAMLVQTGILLLGMFLTHRSVRQTIATHVARLDKLTERLDRVEAAIERLNSLVSKAAA